MKLAILTVLCVRYVSGQEFDVISIKPSEPPRSQRIRVTFEGGPGSADPTRFSCRNCSLSLLVMCAYDVEYHQVAGLDSRTEFYDIAAKVPEGASKDEFRMMLQKLLSNRFKMSLHRELKRVQAYELVVGKNGPKMKESAPEVTVPNATVSNSSRIVLDPEGFPILPTDRSGYASVNGRARMQAFNETMDQLAGKISNQLDVPVINATGLRGRYAFGLHWAGNSVDSTDDTSPNLFSAVELQLGLRLQPGKAVVTILVIDYVDRRPTEN
jgi:uncharacterized protein (TIGR03435 family)